MPVDNVKACLGYETGMMDWVEAREIVVDNKKSRLRAKADLHGLQ
jgi:hypothetical protein